MNTDINVSFLSYEILNVKFHMQHICKRFLKSVKLLYSLLSKITKINSKISKIIRH